MSEARDVDLGVWLDGVSFKPADNPLKQQGHEAVRQVFANIGAVLHPLIPAGRDKSVLYTLLEDGLMRANRALAIAGGPVLFPGVEAYLADLTTAGPLKPDPRVEAYKREQRGERCGPVPCPPFEEAVLEVEATSIAGQKAKQRAGYTLQDLDEE